MSIKFVSVHKVRAGDTLASLSARYRLSSPRAILDIDANKPQRDVLARPGQLPEGLLVHIPPNAVELLRERLYALDRVRPGLLAHFDRLREDSDAGLRRLVLDASDPGESEAIAAALAGLGRSVAEAIDDIAAQAGALVHVCEGMAHTHVAGEQDRAVSRAAGDPLVGLYWLLTPQVLQVWRDLWDRDLWSAKWQGTAALEAWQSVESYSVTVRSVVMTQTDQRIRETQATMRRLLAEPG